MAVINNATAFNGRIPIKSQLQIQSNDTDLPQKYSHKIEVTVESNFSTGYLYNVKDK
jgi:hypothetical protein